MLKILREDSDLIEFNEKMMCTSKSGSRRVTYEILAKSLLYRTLEVGETQAVSELKKYIESEFIPAFNIIAISGIQVDNKVDLWNDISLIPFESVPDCIVKDLYKATGSMIQSMAIGFRYDTPQSALIQNIKIQPKTHETFDGDINGFNQNLRESKLQMESITDTEELSKVYNCLSLVGNSAPMALASWTVIDEWVPCSNMFQSFSTSIIQHDMSGTSAYKWTLQDCGNAPNIIHKYFQLNKNIKDLLKVSLH